MLLTSEVPRCSLGNALLMNLERYPTLLSNSNGEYRDGSSNKTPHIVVAIPAPPLVAYTLQHLRVAIG